MTTYAPNFTGRYRAHYKACGIDHTIQLRKASGATFASVLLLAATVQAIFNDMAALLCDDFEFISADAAEEGSDIFEPATAPEAVTGTVAVADYTPFQKVTHTRFGGRAKTSRVSVEMYGIFWQYANIEADAGVIPYDGVVTAAELPAVATVAGHLNSQAFANSGEATVWRPRALVKVNDFWLRAVRSGGIT